MSTDLPKTLGAFLGHFIAQQKGWFFLLLICHLAWAVDNTVFSYIFKVFLDMLVDYQGDRADVWSVLWPIIAIGAAVWLLIEVMFRSYDYIASFTMPRFEAAIRLAMVEYVQGHSYRYFSDNFAGEIANKIGDMPQSASVIIRLTLTLFFPSLVALIIGASVFATMHPVFALVMVSWFVIHIGTAIWFAARCSDMSKEHSESRSVLSGKIVDSLSNIIAAKLFARGRWEHRFIQEYQQDEALKHQQVLRLVFKIRLIQAVSCFVWMGIGQTWLEIYYWQQGVLSAGDVTYIFYTSWSLIIMAWISGIELPNLFKEIGTCKQALQLIEHPHEIRDIDDAPSIKMDGGAIHFEDVSFDYGAGQTLFSQKTLTLQAGENVGLVGFSGSGKTSFVNLILRFFDINSGRILIDGQDIAKVNRDSLRSQISMIPQDPTLFHRSLMENIRYGREDASDQEVYDAAKKARCDEFIAQLVHGYDSLVGERGTKLSGGQRQRIAIARAIVKNAPILIMDEATSALDSVTEEHIQQAMAPLMAGRTSIVIAHRLSTLSAMDRILVFDKGKIIEDGTHDELLAKAGHYAMMWSKQAGGFLPDKE